MHKECYEMMKSFVIRHVKPLQLRQPDIRVVDIGAFDVNGTFKPLFAGLNYTGIDIATGPNVDRVVELYDFGPEQYDVVISGNTLEHVEDMWAWKDAAIRLLKPGALFCITVPHSLPEHRYPVDCWRIFPDGMRWLFKDLEVLECSKGPIDTMLIGRNK